MPKNIFSKFGFFALLFLRFSLALGQPIINFSDTTSLKSILVCAFGYRSSDDLNSSLKKVRKSHDELFVLV